MYGYSRAPKNGKAQAASLSLCSGLRTCRHQDVTVVAPPRFAVERLLAVTEAGALLTWGCLLHALVENMSSVAVTSSKDNKQLANTEPEGKWLCASDIVLCSQSCRLIWMVHYMILYNGILY